MIQNRSDDLLRTPAHGIPLGELIEKDGEKYLRVKQDKREDIFKITDLINKLFTSKYRKQ